MPSSNPLYSVPGLGGFLASQDRRRAMGQQDMESNIQQMNLADLLNAQKKQALFEQTMKDSIVREPLMAQSTDENPLSPELLRGVNTFVNREGVRQGEFIPNRLLELAAQRGQLPEALSQLKDYAAIQNSVATTNALGQPKKETFADILAREKFEYEKTQPTKSEKPPEYAQLMQIRDAYAAKGDTKNVAEIEGYMAFVKAKNDATGTPYSTPVYDEQGRILSFNNRSGALSIPKSPFDPPAPGEVARPVIGARYSPSLQRDLKAAEGEGKAIGEERGLLPNQKEALISVQTAKQMISEGIYSGGYAKLKMGAAKFTPGVDTVKASRTEQFIAHVGNTVVPRLKEFGGSDTVEEMNYLKQIMGGNITLEESALKSLMDQIEARIQRGINRVNRGLTPDGLQQGQPAQPASTPQLDPLSVTTPDGKVIRFKSPQAAAAFRKKAGL